MVPRPITVRLVGGPLDGREAPSNTEAFFPERLELWSLSAAEVDGDTASYLMCFYDATPNDPGRYEFDRSETRTMGKARYLALQLAESEFERIGALVADPRLIQPLNRGRRRPPTNALPVGEVKALKTKAIDALRRSRPAEFGTLPDERVWAWIRGAVETDIAWALMGSRLHVNGMRTIAQEWFGIELPIRVQSG